MSMGSTFAAKGHLLTIAAGLSLMFCESAVSQSTTVPVPPSDQAAATATAEDTSTRAGVGIDEVVVMARRRSENLQSVPVAVTAFGAADLSSRGIQSTLELQTLVPGVIFNGAGSDSNTTFSIRGQGRDVIGPGLPSVVSYFNEVPLGSWGSVLPAFDVGSIQVLKGPQGTLFGRNTTGGAVLAYSNAPTYTQGGYATATGGQYGWGALEGAVNIPLIDDMLAIRFAGNYVHRNGYTDTHIVNPGIDNVGYTVKQNNLNTKSGRVSILWEPVAGVRNTLVGDFTAEDTHSIGSFPLASTGVDPVAQFGPVPGLGAFIIAGFHCGNDINCDINQQLLRAQAAGPRTTYSDVNPWEHDRFWGLSNTTIVDLAGVTAKNILGFRSTSVDESNNIDGFSLALFNNPSATKHDGQFTEEFQLTGSAFNDKFNWLLGSFYLNDQPTGTTGDGFDPFRPNDYPNHYQPEATWPFSTNTSTLYTDQSKALFVNGAYDLVGLSPALGGLKLNAGIRYTWDTEGVCATTPTPIGNAQVGNLQQCGDSPGSFNSSVNSQAPTWTIGLDYKISDALFIYITDRRGYRAGNINTPALETSPVDLAQFQTYEPQRVDDVEIGAKTEWKIATVAGRFNIAAFHDKFHDLQQQVLGFTPGVEGTTAQNAPTGTILVINSGESTSQGVELDGLVLPYKGLKIDYGVAYLHQVYDAIVVPAILTDPSLVTPNANAPFSNSPRWSYSATAQYQLPLPSASGAVLLNVDWYRIDSFYTNAVKNNGYQLTNAHVDWLSATNSALEVSIFVNNAFNKVYVREYALSGLAQGVFTGTYGDPRMFGGRITYHFGR
jgi:iron complex outermembrane receptor protein